MQQHEVSLTNTTKCKSFMKSDRFCGFSRISSCDNSDNVYKQNKLLLSKCLFQGLSGVVVVETNKLVGFWSFGSLSGEVHLFTRVGAFLMWIQENIGS